VGDAVVIPNQPGWAQRMVTANFNGIDFLTESHDTKGGRRLVVHEFPGAEQPDVEDLGGKADEFSLNAYFIGADYDLFRDNFLLALNMPGAVWLMHPWRGALWVRAHSWSLHESNDKGGYCTVSVSFVPGGQTQTALVDRTDLADRSIAVFAAQCEVSYTQEPMPAASLVVMKVSLLTQLDGLRALLSLATLPLTWVSQAQSVLDGIHGDMDALLALPKQYATAMGLLAQSLGAGNGTRLPDTQLPQVVSSLVAMVQMPSTLTSGTADSLALRVNLSRAIDLRSQLLLGSAARLALADYRVAGDRDAALASVVGAIDALLPTMPDALFQAALDMRAALIDALLAQDLAPAQVRDIVHPLPATVLAHRMRVAEDVFLAVNKVRHPLFVQGRIYA
jgi:prophage DNA circulation protein